MIFKSSISHVGIKTEKGTERYSSDQVITWIDAKVHSFARDIKDDQNSSSAWTPYNPTSGRRLFKGFKAGAEPMIEGEG